MIFGIAYLNLLYCKREAQFSMKHQLLLLCFKSSFVETQSALYEVTKELTVLSES